MNAQKIGLEIRLLRERLKLSAKDLAERVGLSPSQMSRLESGQRRVDAVLLSKIARALDVHPSYFFQGFEEGPAPAGGEPGLDDEEDDEGPDEGGERAEPAPAGLPAVVGAPPAHLGRVIRQERHRRHVTADELARKVGKGKHFILDIEGGRTDLLTYETLTRIARALRMDPELFFEAQRAEVRDLRRAVQRLERAHTERTLAEMQLDGGAPGSRRGLPVIEGPGGGLPVQFDGLTPEGNVVDHVYVPGLRVASGFAVTLRGDEMESPQAPSFRPGEVLVFTAEREPRHRDHVLAVLEGESVFRQLFLDPKGRVRLQPRNLDYPPHVLEREEVRALFLLVARIGVL